MFPRLPRLQSLDMFRSIPILVSTRIPAYPGDAVKQQRRVFTAEVLELLHDFGATDTLMHSSSALLEASRVARVGFFSTRADPDT